MSSGKQRPSILDKSLSRGKSEVSLTAYALLFSEMVQYSHNRVTSVNELHNKLVSSFLQILLMYSFVMKVFNLLGILYNLRLSFYL